MRAPNDRAPGAEHTGGGEDQVDAGSSPISATTPDIAGEAKPYATSAHAYLEAGWNPLPILDMGKGQVPAGFTGYAARTVTADDVTRWVDQQNLGTRRVCLRLMYEVGIDIDSYDDTKNARGDWEALVAEHGELPPTVRVSARFGTDYDGLAGIKIYQLPANARSLVEQRIWKGQLGSGIDVIRLGHRQVVAWPSIHPVRGTRYQYLDERTGQIVEGPLPPVDTIPELPDQWVQVLLKQVITGTDGGERRQREYHGGHRSQWWTDGPPCQAVNTSLGQVLRTLPSGRHDGATSGLLRLTRLGEQGHRGVQRAVDQLLGAFVAAVDGTRGEPPLDEWKRMVTDLDALIDAGGLTPEHKRGCCRDTSSDVPPWEPDEPENQPSSQYSRVTEDTKSTNTANTGPKLWMADDLKPAAPTKWLLREHLPLGAVSVLVGDEGIGKSLWWVLIAVHITTGKPLPELRLPAREPRDVLLVITEDSWTGEVRTRLEVAGVDLAHVIVIAEDEDGSGSPVFPRDMPLVIAAAETKDVALVVVDAWLDTVGANTQVKDPQQARAALHPWREAATVTGACVLLLAHSNRADVGNLRDRVGATGALRQKARVLLYAAQPPDQPGILYLGPDKANSSRKGHATAYHIRVIQVRPVTDDDDGTIGTLVVEGPTDNTMEGHYAAWRAEAYRASHPKADDQVWPWLSDYFAEHGEDTELGRQVVASEAKDAAKVAGHNPQRLAPLVREHGGQVVPAGAGKPWIYRMAAGGSTFIHATNSAKTGKPEDQSWQSSQSSQSPEHGKSETNTQPDQLDLDDDGPF